MKRTTALILLLLVFIGSDSYAKGKMDVMFGFFSLQAKTKDKKGNVDNLGAYQLNYRYAVANYLEVAIGYSLIASKTFSGDFGFGPDIGLVYFPFSSSNAIEANSENVTYRSYELYKPYLVSAFHQRQYQSIQSSYAGFSFGAGVEIYWKSNISINIESRYLPLGGPEGATSNEFDLLSGLTFNF